MTRQISKPIRNVEISLLNRHKAGLLEGAGGRVVKFHLTEFICMSKDNNYLHYYQFSTNQLFSLHGL